MKQKLHTARAVVVEGKYDAARLTNLIDAPIYTTDGFAVYSDKARRSLFCRLAKAQGLLLLLDSDAAGFQIRTFLTNLVGAEHVLQAYVPACPGKEARKAEPGREGLLGVEGIGDELLCAALETALRQETAPGAAPAGRQVNYTDLYEWGFSGTPDAASRRSRFLQSLGLPPRLSKKELVAALNALLPYEELARRAAAFAPEAREPQE